MMDGFHVTDDQGNPVQPIGWQGAGPDFEVYSPQDRGGNGRWVWEAYDEDIFVGTGTHRSKFMAYWAMARFKKKYV
jgi:hypothetical protein